MQVNSSLVNSPVVATWQQPQPKDELLNEIGINSRKETKQLKALKKQERKENFAKKQTIAPVAIQEITKNILLQDTDTILALRFSQDTVESVSSDGLNLFESIRRDGWRQGSPIKVVMMPDTEQTSLDNRRLLALKEVVRHSHSFFHDNNAAEMLLFNHAVTSAQIKKDSIRLQKKLAWKNSADIGRANLGLSQNTYGAMVFYRMRLGEGDVLQSPYGFTNDPTVRQVMINDENAPYKYT